MIRKFFSYIAGSTIIYGCLAMLFNFVIVGNSRLYKGELPIGRVQGIVEKNGKIYVGLGEYSRIQIYDLKGRFLHYINTSTGGKDYNFIIDSTGTPDITLIYQRDESVDRYLQNDGQSTYFISRKFPLVVSKRIGKVESAIIKQPRTMFFWSGVINAWIIEIIGSFVFIAINSSKIYEVIDNEQIPKQRRPIEILKKIF